MGYNFKRPNQNNVDLEDSLITYIPKLGLKAMPITFINEKGVRAEANNGKMSSSEEYHNALILKEDGTYLIGENISRIL